MSEWIDRKIAVQGVKELFSMGDCYCDELSIVGMLNGLPSQPKWIPVTEALPEEKEMVLITNNKGHVRCGQYQGTFDDKNYRWWWKHNTLETVIAWMSLPEPYKGN